MRIEKRKQKRFFTQDDAFAAMRADFKKIGKINDISTGGLSFSYLVQPSPKAKASVDSQFVDIFLSGNQYHLPEVPCNVVYDIPNPAFFKTNDAEMFRCGLEFKPLNTNQIGQLNMFIKKYTK